jgi:hypothetical protein
VVIGRRRLLGGVAALVLAVAVVALLLRVTRPAPEAMPASAGGIAVRGALAPRSYLFGDSMVARLEILVDRAVFDPDRISIDTRFAPFSVVGAPRRERHDFPDLTRIRYAFELECLALECVPESIERPIQFAPAVVSHDRTQIEQFVWPGFPIVARVRETSISAIPGSDWRASSAVLPPAYRLHPTLLAAGLAGAAIALVILAAALTVAGSAGLARRWRRLRLTPLEHALAGLERANAAGVEADQRLALDRLADELRTRGAGDLALTARRLAWAEDVPAVERTEPLSAGVRALLNGRTNGRS